MSKVNSVPGQVDPGAKERHDRLVMMAVSVASSLIIAVVLYLAGAFSRSTG